jgi:phosphoglycolate phosphatase-like HAD superfamily hydrolase
MPTILLFDIDGTLVRTGGAGKAAVEDALRQTFGVAEVRDGVPYSGRTDRAILRDVLAVHDIDPTPANVDRFAEAYLALLPDRLERVRGEVCPGVPALLPRLAANPAVRVGLLTGNVRRGAEVKLRHYGLWEHFPFGGFGDGRESRDDVARAAVAAAAEHVGGPVDPADVWVIGDTPHDITCARAVGANAVAVATGWTPVADLHAAGADLVLDHLEDVALLPGHWFAD